MRMQRRKRREKPAPLRATASTKTPGTPVFTNPLSKTSSSRTRATNLPSRTSGGRGGSGGGSSTLAEGLMFSHKPNPIFDTADTNSSRGDDYEVINLSNARGTSGVSISGLEGLPSVRLAEFSLLCSCALPNVFQIEEPYSCRWSGWSRRYRLLQL